MKATLFAAGYTGYLIFGLFQIAATASGIQHLTGFWWLMCWVGAILVGWVPVVGTGLGIYGAHGSVGVELAGLVRALHRRAGRAFPAAAHRVGIGRHPPTNRGRAGARGPRTRCGATARSLTPGLAGLY